MTSPAELEAAPQRFTLTAAVVRRLAASRTLEVAAVGAVSALALALLAMRTALLTRDNPVFAEPGWDHHAYIAMARDYRLDFHLAPFGWRVLNPLAAGVLPLSLQTSFFVIAFVCLVATSVGVYAMAGVAGFDRRYQALAVAFFLSLGWAVKFALMDFWLPDAALFLAVVAAITCAIRRQPLAFAAVLAIGVAIKESAIFVAPLYYTLNTGRLLDRRLFLRSILLAVPALVVLAAVRLLISARNEDLAYAQSLTPQLQAFRGFIPTYNYYDLLRDIGYHQRLHDRSLDTLLLYTTGTWGVGLLALALLGVVRKPLLALRLSPFLVLVYAQLLFALNIERLLVLGFPAVIWLALEGIALLSERASLRPLMFLPVPLLLFALNFQHAGSIPIRFELDAELFLVWLTVLFALPQSRAAPADAAETRGGQGGAP